MDIIKMESYNKNVLFIAAILALILCYIVIGVIFYYCWNHVMPKVFGFKPVTLTQSIAILIGISIIVWTIHLYD